MAERATVMNRARGEGAKALEVQQPAKTPPGS
jgi:hypothetical protein